MLMQIVVYATLFTFAMTGLSSAQGVRPNDVPLLPVVGSSGVQSQPDATRPTQTLLTEIVTWLSANFDLPAIQDHPSVQFVSPAKLASMRYEDKGCLPDRPCETGVYEPIEAAHQREVVALMRPPRERSFFPISGPERLPLTNRSWCTKWFITSRIWANSNSNARGLAKSSLTRLKINGLSSSERTWRQSLRSICSLSLFRLHASTDRAGRPAQAFRRIAHPSERDG